MASSPQVVLSALADEAAYQKTAVQQFSALAALGLQYYSVRHIDAGSGVKNVMQLSYPEIQSIRHLEAEYGLNVASIASPLGKVKLLDEEDGTANAYVPFKKYLEKDVRKACDIAHAFETKLIRGFSFYPPKNSDPREYLAQAVDQIGQMADQCLRSDLTFGLEVEANLVGRDGHLLAEIYRQLGDSAMVLVFDAANILTQGYTTSEVLEQFNAMKPGLGWLHIKDYRLPSGSKLGRLEHLDEEALKHFVPADRGDCAHEVILKELRTILPKLDQKLQRRGIPGVFLDLEPHLKSGGQFGGSSGPDGMGVALRGLCRVLDFVQVDYHLRDLDDVTADRREVSLVDER